MHIPGYRIIRKINHGGMSTVYLAIQESVGRVVALKVMSPALNGDPTFSERFQREANIVGQLSHPNIVSIYDIGRHNNLNYIAMDYLPGGSIHDKMLTGITEEYALRILREIASALDHAHSKGYVHRDIKPENILFRDDNSAVLTDFGVARALLSGSRHTHAGTVVGTPHYMSPEQTRGKTVDARSDVYSLGIVFFEMLTGSVPYQGEEAVSIALKHLAAPIPTLPAQFMHLQPLLDKMLNKEPDKRYQRGNDLVADIEAMELQMRNADGVYLASQHTVGRQLLVLIKMLMRQSYHLARSKTRQLVNFIRSLRFNRERGFYRHLDDSHLETVLTQQNTLIATRLQRQLSAQTLWETLRQHKHRYVLAGAAAVFIVGFLLLMLLNGTDLQSSATETTTLATVDIVENDVDRPVAEDAKPQQDTPPANRESDLPLDSGISSPDTIAEPTAPLLTSRNLPDPLLVGLNTNANTDTISRREENNPAQEPADTENSTAETENAAVNDTPEPEVAAEEKEPEPIDPIYTLTVETDPPGSRVRIMNIRERYQPGIELSPGRYQVEVTHPGYNKYLQWVTLDNKDLAYKVTLEEVQAVGTVFSHTLASGGKGPSLVVVPPGSFSMGGPDEDAQPRHTVRFSAPLAVTRHEITFAEYERFARTESMPLPGDNRWGREDRPVINISWEEAAMYARWLREETGQNYRLPTEAEWEYIAKAGKDSHYWWGDDPEGASGRANCRRSCDSSFTGLFRSESAPVGNFEANPFGVYDTAGNVAEWVADCYRPTYNNASASGEAYTDADCERRVVRGGSMREDAAEVNSYRRRAELQHTYHEDIGFRLVVDL